MGAIFWVSNIGGKNMAITKEQIANVKSRGFLINRGTEFFSGRIVTAAGVFTYDELRAVSDCAEKFGNGKVIFTSRLAAEIVGIPFDKIPEAEQYMQERGLYFGGTGAKIRPITACKGTTCIYGNIDTQGIAKVLYDKFYIGMSGIKLPHKFKIAVGGCPNSCMKPSLNDVGIEGCRDFTFDRDRCRGCKKCIISERCTTKSVSVVDGKATVNTDTCSHCGFCIGKCPFGAFPKEAPSLCRIYVGGTWGKKQRMGTLLSNLYTTDEVPEVIEKVMLWYKEHGYVKERLGATIDRVGIESLENAIADSDLLDRKEEILAAPICERQ